MMERPGGGRGELPPDDAGEGPAEAPESGVMGALPRSRPSIRSPRRDRAQRLRQDSGQAAGERPEAAASAEPDAGEPGLEDLARAGASAAAGAATLGLRIAGRAASAVRGALERR